MKERLKIRTRHMPTRRHENVNHNYDFDINIYYCEVCDAYDFVSELSESKCYCGNEIILDKNKKSI